jgi:HEAT repeat protein
MPDLETLLEELTSGDDERAEAAAPRFVEHGSIAVDALAGLLGEEDANTRWWATRALGTFEGLFAKKYLRLGLQDQDIAVQQCALLGLREHPDPNAVSDLTSLLTHPDWMIKRLAADALIATGKEATQELIAVIENGDQAARLEAVRALATIGDQTAIPTLFKVLEEDSTLIRYWAEEGLQKMGVGMVFLKPD